MLRKIFPFAVSIAVILSLAGAVILYGRGYRYNPQNNSINTTGILSVSSYPEKASIYINGKLKSATNASLTLSPDWYQVKITKEGYQSWEKNIRIQGEVVSQIDALLIPNNPSFKAITSTGIENPVLSSTGTKIAYFITGAETNPAPLKSKNGLWILELRTTTLGNRSEPKQVFIADQNYNYGQAKIYWSPDEKEIVIAIYNEEDKEGLPVQAWLVNTDNSADEIPIDVTGRTAVIFTKWEQESLENKELQLTALPLAMADLLKNNAADIRFSPDEKKILYEATSSAEIKLMINPPLIGANPTEEERLLEDGKYYIYDIKEDKNFFITNVPKVPSGALPPVWYTDSKHLLIIENDSINIVDYDGTNKRSIYTGPFEKNIVFPWSTGSKIVILTNFNKQAPLVDFYEIDLR